MRGFSDPLYAAPTHLPQGILNPALYLAIKANYGNVWVSRRGERLYETTVLHPVTGYPDSQITHYGEQYYLSCPFCNDTRKRLFINHTFGQPDPNGKLRYIVKCFNEECFKVPSNMEKLKHTLTGFVNANVRSAPPLVFTTNGWGNAAAVAPPVVQPDMPGEVIPLSKLARLSPTHPAVQYMLGEREYTLDMLDRYVISYCGHSHTYPVASNRIIFPYFKNGRLLGWQARYIGTPPHKHVPKYYNLPNMQKSIWMYNFDVAGEQDMLVITEGAPAVHFIGDKATALLGKSLSPIQHQLIVERCSKKPIVVWLDDEAQAKAEFMCDMLRASGLFVVNVKPTSKLDPADYGTKGSWRIISDTLKNAV